MLGQLAWVLGLGFIGLVFFGPVGGSVLGAIGFVIGSRKTQKPTTAEAAATRPPVEETRDESSVAVLNPSTSSSQRAPLGFWIGVGGVAVLALLVYWSSTSPARSVAGPESELDPSRQSPNARAAVFPASEVWSSDDCLRQHFGAAMVIGMAVPPEVRVFCAYPWDVTALRALSEQLVSVGLEPERLLNELTPAPAQIELQRSLMAVNRSMPMPDGLREIYDLMKVLPYVWRARPDRPAWKPLLLKNFQHGFVGILASASVSVDWKQKLTHDTLARAHTVSDGVVVYLQQGTSLTVEELVLLVFGIYDKRLDKLEANPLTEILRSVKSSGLHWKHGQTIVMLTMYTGLLDELSDHLRSLPTLQGAWRPAKNSARSASRPLEIYMMRAPIEGWCKGVRANAHGQYCPGEDRVLVVDSSELTLNGSSPGMALGMNAPIFHELAHAYLNPVEADEYPFVAEGLATAFGERMLRATAAAIPASSGLTLEQSAAFGQIFQVPASGGAGPPGSMPSNAELLEYARKQIERSRPTQYAQGALCRLDARPLTTGPVTAYLSQSRVTFASNTAEEMRLAYAYAWAIFHYGVDTAGLGLGVEGDQLDAAAVQEAATELAGNRAVNDALLERLDKFFSQVNARVRADIKKWNIQCPK